jgi:hypothetical protein
MGQEGGKIYFRPVHPELDDSLPSQERESRILSEAEKLAELCGSLLDPYDDDSKSTVDHICREYGNMDRVAKGEFQTHLAVRFGAQLTQENITSIWDVLSTKGGETPAPLLLQRLMLAATPRFNDMFSIFALHGKVDFLLKFRSELLAHMKKANSESVDYLKVSLLCLRR